MWQATSLTDARVLDKAGVIHDLFRVKTLLIDENSNEGILRKFRFMGDQFRHFELAREA